MHSVVLVIDKFVTSAAEAVAGIRSGSTLLVSGFGVVGMPAILLESLLDGGADELVIVANNAGVGEGGLGALLRERRVRKIICSYPRSPGSIWFERRFEEGSVDLELTPQGTLSERIRAGGSGLAGFYTPTGVGTELAEGKEVRYFAGRPYVFESSLRGDVALIKSYRSDRWGNCVYRGTARNFAPTMAMAADLTIVECQEAVELGGLAPDAVVTPGVFIDRIYCPGRPATPAIDGVMTR
jgi:3-oxoadipate CoA-transferase alpha subunit